MGKTRLKKCKVQKMVPGPSLPQGSWGLRSQNCRHFWTRLVSSRLKSVNSYRERGFVVAKPRTVVTFGLVSGLHVSKVLTVTGIGRVVVAKRKTVVTFSKVSTVKGIGGVVVAKPRTVVTFGLVSHLRVFKVSTVTGIGGGVVVAKPRTVVTSGFVSSLRVSKVSTVTGISGVVVAKRRTVHFWTRRSRQKRREKRGERREERGERRGEKREERRDRREKRGERREEGREGREEGREERGERREERGERRGKPAHPCMLQTLTPLRARP